MSQPRKQHYVPQVYLKNFSFGGDKSPKIFVLSTSSQKIFQRAVEEVAVEKDFYTINSL